MTEEESQNVYTSLVNLLNEARLAWLVQQVEEQLSYGRFRNDVKTKVFRNQRNQEDQTFSVVLSKASANLSGTEEYNSYDKLRMLIDAIRTVANDSLSVEEAAISYFSEKGKELGVKKPEVIKFSDGGQSSSITVSSEDVEDRKEAIAQLLRLLSELEKEI